MTNVAMENPVNKWRFIAGKIIHKWAIFHGYVKFPEGNGNVWWIFSWISLGMLGYETCDIYIYITRSDSD